jgi:hypothetical protein
MVGAPWYMLNTVIGWDNRTPTVKEEIIRYSSQYSARLGAQPETQQAIAKTRPNDHLIGSTV